VAFNKWSSLYIGVLGIFTLYLIVFLVGSRRIIAWPNNILFLFFAFVYGRILSLLLGSLEIAPEKMSLTPFHNKTKAWKYLTIGSMATIVLIGLSSPFWKDLPRWGSLSLIILMLLACIILTFCLGSYLLGIYGIPKNNSKNKTQEPLRVEPAAEDRRESRS
jgi:hypothetical protein